MKKCTDKGYLRKIVLENKGSKNLIGFLEKWPSTYTFFDSLWDYLKNAKSTDMQKYHNFWRPVNFADM